MKHVTRFSDASTFDEICIHCGLTDQGGRPIEGECPNAPEPDPDDTASAQDREIAELMQHPAIVEAVAQRKAEEARVAKIEESVAELGVLAEVIKKENSKLLLELADYDGRADEVIRCWNVYVAEIVLSTNPAAYALLLAISALAAVRAKR